MTMKQETAKQLELWELERLIPNARNARTHSDAQVAEIAGSIRAFGFMAPVLVDSQGSILAGHGRVLAARQLKLERIPVLVVDHLSEAEKRAYSIADNKIALNAGWDEELLRVELEALVSEGIEPLGLGFSEEDFNALMVRLTPEPIHNPDVVPRAPAITVSRTGDIWQLGEHKLLCGDPLDRASYALLLEGPAAMVFTALPYTVDSFKDSANDLAKGLDSFLEAACGYMIANTEGALYISTSSAELHMLRTAFSQAGGHWSTCLIWGKSRFTRSHADYQLQYEPVLYGWPEGKAHYWCGARDQGDLWMTENTETSDWNSMNKPVELIERALQNSSRPSDIVLDPFAGAGSTVIACEKTGRAARVMEREPKYCDVVIERWQDFTGKQAIHTGTGLTRTQRSAMLASGE